MDRYAMSDSVRGSSQALSWAGAPKERRNAVAAADIKGMMAPMRDSSARVSADAVHHVRLWDQHGQRIYRYCFRRTGDPELAEDLTSIVFLEAWRRRRKRANEAPQELPWLYGVAANVLRNQWRTQRRYRMALARLPRPRDEDDPAQAVVDRLDDEAQMARLRDGLRALPRTQQDVLSLCVWEGLTAKEAAVALGTSEATVRTRLHRARKRLRTLDEANGYAPPAGVPRVEGERS